MEMGLFGFPRMLVSSLCSPELFSSLSATEVVFFALEFFSEKLFLRFMRRGVCALVRHVLAQFEGKRGEGKKMTRDSPEQPSDTL